MIFHVLGKYNIYIMVNVKCCVLFYLSPYFLFIKKVFLVSLKQNVLSRFDLNI